MKSLLLYLSILLCSSSFAQRNFQEKLDSIAKIRDNSIGLSALQQLIQEKLPKKNKLAVLEELCKRSLDANNAKFFTNYCEEGIELAKSLKNDSSLSFFIKSNGAYQSYQGKQLEAIESFKQSAEIAERGGFSLLLAQNYNNIGGLLIDEKDYVNAEIYLNKSQEISKKKSHELVFKRIQLLSTRLLATLYDRTGRKEAGELFEALLIETEKIQDTFLICSNLMFYARYQEGKGRVEEALQSMNRAHELIRNTNHASTIMAVLGMKASIHQKLGQFQEANSCLSEYISFSNRYYNQENQRLLNEFDKKLELNDERFRRAQAEIKTKNAEAKSTKLFYVLILSAALLVILSLLVFIWIRKRNRRNAEIIKNQRFSSLLEGEEKERIRIARELHDGIVQELGLIQRKLYTIDADQDKLYEIQTNFSDKINSIRSLTHNMMPLDLKNSSQAQSLESLFVSDQSKIEFQLEIFGNLNVPDQIFLQLYRIIQELLTNAEKHSNGTSVSCILDVHTSLLRFVYEDNGVGMKKEKTTGIGLSNIKARVEAVNGKSNWYSSPDEGTQFILTIPL